MSRVRPIARVPARSPATARPPGGCAGSAKLSRMTCAGRWPVRTCSRRRPARPTRGSARRARPAPRVRPHRHHAWRAVRPVRRAGRTAACAPRTRSVPRRRRCAAPSRAAHGRHAEVQVRGIPAIQAQLLLAAGPALRERRIVEETQPDRLLDLVGVRPGEQHPGRCGSRPPGSASPRHADTLPERAGGRRDQGGRASGPLAAADFADVRSLFCAHPRPPVQCNLGSVESRSFGQYLCSQAGAARK